jgi:hypothetical protein
MRMRSEGSALASSSSFAEISPMHACIDKGQPSALQEALASARSPDLLEAVWSRLGLWVLCVCSP